MECLGAVEKISSTWLEEFVFEGRSFTNCPGADTGNLF